MVQRMVRAMYGDVSSDEIKKFGLLALTFFFIIGAYWLLRPLKDSIFFGTVGGGYQPIAKQFSISPPSALRPTMPPAVVPIPLISTTEKHFLIVPPRLRAAIPPEPPPSKEIIFPIKKQSSIKPLLMSTSPPAGLSPI